MSGLLKHCSLVARAFAWIGIAAIIVLSVVPATDRPVTGSGSTFEHFMAFALVAAAFAVGYRWSLAWLVVSALFFCGGIELLQIPLPTRHARLSDFIIDCVASCLAICVVVAVRKNFDKSFSRSVRRSSSAS